jgi:hypothetical protein
MNKTLSGASQMLFILLVFFGCKNNQAQTDNKFPGTLPVYEVIQTGANDTVEKELSDKFKIPLSELVNRNGALSFTDTSSFLRIPSSPVKDSGTLNILKARAKNEIKDAPIQYDAIDFDSIRNVLIADSAIALKAAEDVFHSPIFHFESIKPKIEHTVFSAFYKDANGKTISVNQPVDTRVNFELYDKNGYLFTGPGAVVKVTFNADYKASNLQYAWRNLKPGRTVKIISVDEAKKRIAKLLPEGAKINLKLVYWCPPFNRQSSPTTILPWYSYTGTIINKNANGRPIEITTKERLIPATDDSAFVPRVRLVAREGSNNLVTASVDVSGGRPPYSYSWTGSNPSILLIDSNTVSYQPIVRTQSIHDTSYNPNIPRQFNENISIIVTDANGISMQVTQVIAVFATQIERSKLNYHGTASYGCESPGEPELWTQERVGWQQGMANSGGGIQSFCWLGNDSWPGDYIKPKVPGTLPATPWINGDIDFSNWGVNTANLVLVNGDGWPDGFTAMYPGAPQSDYNSRVDLYRPTYPAGTILLPIPTYPTYYNTDYKNSWGPIGPNDRLYWLAGLLCECLNPTDADGLTTDERWGPAFGGLHIFTGFASDAAYSAGAFPKAFAEDILGVHGSPQTIKDAWFNACTATNEGIAAAMGPITTGGVSDLNDYYIGQGSRGPTIVGANITGWWYMHQ